MSGDWIQNFIQGISRFAGKKSVDAIEGSAKSLAKNINTDLIAGTKASSGLGTFFRKLFGVAGADENILERKVTGEMAKRVSGAVGARQAAEEAMKGLKESGYKNFDAAFESFIGGTYAPDDAFGVALKNYKSSLEALGVKPENMRTISGDIANIAGNKDVMGALNQMSSFGFGDAWGMSLRSLFENDVGKITTWSMAKGVARGTAPIWGTGLTISALRTPQRLVENVTEARAREGKL